MAEIVEFASLDGTTQDLIKRSLSARERAYCPYSKFKVGCALLCRDGTVFEGCNVENTSYGLSICAERTALVSAVAAGHQAFVMLAVSAELGETFVPPCGACRQFIAEFGAEIDVYLARPALDMVVSTSIAHLLPLNLSAMQLALGKS